MRILRAGDKGEALAPGRGRVPIVYEYRTVHLEETGVDVPDVLVGVCAETGEILTIPAQSTPRLRRARRASKEETFQVRLPAQLQDALWLLADHYQARAKKFAPALIRFYLEQAVAQRGLARRLARLSRSPTAVDGPRRRLTVRTDARLLRNVDRLMSEMNGISRSDLVCGAIVAAKQDVLDGRAPARADKLGAVARAV